MTPTEDPQGARARNPSPHPLPSPPARMAALEGTNPLPTPRSSEEEEEVEEGVSSSSSSVELRVGEDGGVRTLLQFVTVAGGDIKAALDRSAPCKRSVDHRKYLQRQLKKFTGFVPEDEPLSPPHPYPASTSPESRDSTTACQSEPGKSAESAESLLLLPGVHSPESSSSSSVTAPPPVKQDLRLAAAQSGSVDTDREPPTIARVPMPCKTLPFDMSSVDARYMFSSGTAKHHDTGVALGQHLTAPDHHRCCSEKSDVSKLGPMAPTAAHRGHSLTTRQPSRHDFETDPLFERVINQCAGHKNAAVLSPQTEGVPGAPGGDKEPCVPLRHRRLPASFWQEPDVPKRMDIGAIDSYSKYGSMLLPGGLYKDLMTAPGGVYNGGVSSHYPVPSQLAAVGLSGGYESSIYQSLAQAKYSSGELSSLGQYPPRWPHGSAQYSSIQKSPGNLSHSMAVLESRLHSYAQDMYHRTSHQVSSPQSTAPYSPSTAAAAAAAAAGILDPLASPSDLAHRSHVWRPIPTKSMTLYPSRYHPFADVH